MIQIQIRLRNLVPACTLVLAALVPSAALAQPGSGSGSGAANQLSKDGCHSLIELGAAPYRKEVRTVWVEDRLFMYVEVLKQLSSNLDHDPRARAAIDAFRRGQGSAAALTTLLRAQADETVSYADSLARRFNAPFYWHYPVVHVEEGTPRRVYVTLPTGVGSYALRMELGADSRGEAAQAKESAASILKRRTTIRLTAEGTLAPTDYSSEKDYLMRHDHVPASCFEIGSPSERLALAPPSDNGQPAVSQRSSSGRPEGAVVMGFPVSDYAGPRGAGSSGSGSASVAPPDAPADNGAGTSGGGSGTPGANAPAAGGPAHDTSSDASPYGPGVDPARGIMGQGILPGDPQPSGEL